MSRRSGVLEAKKSQLPSPEKIGFAVTPVPVIERAAAGELVAMGVISTAASPGMNREQSTAIIME